MVLCQEAREEELTGYDSQTLVTASRHTNNNKQTPQLLRITCHGTVWYDATRYKYNTAYNININSGILVTDSPSTNNKKKQPNEEAPIYRQDKPDYVQGAAHYAQPWFQGASMACHRVIIWSGTFSDVTFFALSRIIYIFHNACYRPSFWTTELFLLPANPSVIMSWLMVRRVQATLQDRERPKTRHHAKPSHAVMLSSHNNSQIWPLFADSTIIQNCYGTAVL